MREKREAQSVTNGSFHRLDLEPERARYNLPPGRTREQIEASAKASIAAITLKNHAIYEREDLP